MTSEIERLREEVAELKEEKRQRDAAFYAVNTLLPREWKLTRQNRQVLLALLRHPLQIHSRAMLMDAIGCPDSDDSYTSVLIAALRNKLTKHNIKIIVEKGLGYRLSPESIGIVQAAIASNAGREMQRIKSAADTYSLERL